MKLSRNGLVLISPFLSVLVIILLLSESDVLALVLSAIILGVGIYLGLESRNKAGRIIAIINLLLLSYMFLSATVGVHQSLHHLSGKGFI